MVGTGTLAQYWSPFPLPDDQHVLKWKFKEYFLTRFIVSSVPYPYPGAPVGDVDPHQAVLVAASVELRHESVQPALPPLLHK